MNLTAGCDSSGLDELRGQLVEVKLANRGEPAHALGPLGAPRLTLGCEMPKRSRGLPLKRIEPLPSFLDLGLGTRLQSTQCVAIYPHSCLPFPQVGRRRSLTHCAKVFNRTAAPRQFVRRSKSRLRQCRSRFVARAGWGAEAGASRHGWLPARPPYAGSRPPGFPPP